FTTKGTWRKAHTMSCERRVESLDPLAGRIVLAHAAEEEPVVYRQPGRLELADQKLGEFHGAAAVIRDDGGSLWAGKVDIDAADSGGRAHVVERGRIVDPGNEEELDLLRQKRLRHPCLDRGVS